MKAIDLTGQDFGQWHVLRSAGRSSRGDILWLCRCSCGKERAILSYNLRHGLSTSCGHDRGVKRRSDLTGQRYGHLTAVERVGYRAGNSLWRCRCDCGNESVVSAGNLTSGHTTSCGCALAAAQQSPEARVAAQAFSPLTSPGEQHIAARSFLLKHGGVTYTVHNLRHFVRTHPELFDISGDASSVAAVSKVLYDAGSRGYCWHGWSVARISDD